jgi:SAM-dependent methyltransferase
MNLREQFIDVPLDESHVHLYVVRMAIVRALRQSLPEMRGELLDIGCGLSPYRELFLSAGSHVTRYIGLDLHDNRSYANKPDLVWDGVSIPLPDEAIGTAVATEVLEHVPNPAAELCEFHRVLQPGGKLFLTVPFFWMLHEVPYDEFRYTPYSLERLLREAGFREIHVRALSGWNGSLVQMYANWVHYSDESRRLRFGTLRMLMPVIKFLLKRDRIPDGFASCQMPTGFFCTATK